jgi:hypothetical protein
LAGRRGVLYAYAIATSRTHWRGKTYDAVIMEKRLPARDVAAPSDEEGP